MRGQPSRNFMRKEKHEQRRLIVRWFDPFFRIIDSRISGERERCDLFCHDLERFFSSMRDEKCFLSAGNVKPEG